MYLNIDVVSKDLTEQIREYTEEAIKKEVINNEQFLKDIVKECIRGAIKCEISNILQEKGYRIYLRDKVMEYLQNGN